MAVPHVCTLVFDPDPWPLATSVLLNQEPHIHSSLDGSFHLHLSIMTIPMDMCQQVIGPCIYPSLSSYRCGPWLVSNLIHVTQPVEHGTWSLSMNVVWICVWVCVWKSCMKELYGCVRVGVGAGSWELALQPSTKVGPPRCCVTYPVCVCTMLWCCPFYMCVVLYVCEAFTCSLCGLASRRVCAWNVLVRRTLCTCFVQLCSVSVLSFMYWTGATGTHLP